MPVRFETAGGGLPAPPTVPGNQPILIAFIEFPDAFPGNITVGGQVTPAPVAGGLAAAVQFTGSPLALPGVPGGGLSLNWILEVNTTSGALAIKAGTAATTGTQVTPTPDAGNIVVLTHTITNGDTIPWVRNPIMADLNQ